MRRRSGRKPHPLTPRPYPNNVLALRLRAGLEPKEAAQRAGISLSYYAMIEGGRRRLNTDTETKLAIALSVAPGELIIKSTRILLPVRYIVCAQESEAAPLEWEVTEPMAYEGAPSRLKDPENCFVAYLEDDSADIDHKPGTSFFVRPIEEFGGRLPVGARIIVQFLIDPVGTPGPARTLEILFGWLDRSLTGDLQLLTRSTNPQVNKTRHIQDGSERLRRVSERLLQFIPPAAEVDYRPKNGDRGIILGVVERAEGPT